MSTKPSGNAGWGDVPALFETLMFILRIYLYALAVLQCQGEPRVLLHSTGFLGQEVIEDLNLGLLKRGFLS